MTFRVGWGWTAALFGWGTGAYVPMFWSVKVKEHFVLPPCFTGHNLLLTKLLYSFASKHIYANENNTHICTKQSPDPQPHGLQSIGFRLCPPRPLNNSMTNKALGAENIKYLNSFIYRPQKYTISETFDVYLFIILNSDMSSIHLWYLSEGQVTQWCTHEGNFI